MEARGSRSTRLICWNAKKTMNEKVWRERREGSEWFCCGNRPGMAERIPPPEKKAKSGWTAQQICQLCDCIQKPFQRPSHDFKLLKKHLKLRCEKCTARCQSKRTKNDKGVRPCVCLYQKSEKRALCRVIRNRCGEKHRNRTTARLSFSLGKCYWTDY